MTIDEILETLQARKANLRCDELSRLLESLGFVVERVKKGNHKKVKHHGLEGFPGSGFDCGHGRNPKVKPGYANKMKHLILDYRSEMEEYLEREND